MIVVQKKVKIISVVFSIDDLPIGWVTRFGLTSYIRSLEGDPMRRLQHDNSEDALA